MLNIFGYCHSSDVVFTPGKVRDRFRIMLGSGYSFRLGKTTRINTSVKFQYSGLYWPQTVLDDAESAVDDRLDDVIFIPSNTQNISDRLSQSSTSTVLQGPPINSSFLVGQPGSIFRPNPSEYRPTPPSSDDFGNGGYFNWNLSPVLQEFEYIGFSEPQEPVSPGNLNTDIGGGFQGFGNVKGSAKLSGGRGVPDLQVPNAANIAETLPRVTQDNVHTLFLPPFKLDLGGDDYYSVNLSFNPIVEVKKVAKDFGQWDAYQCRVFIPEFLALLASNHNTAEDYFNLTLVPDWEQYDGFVTYIKGLYDVLDPQIKAKTSFRHYSFKYDMPISFGDSLPTRNIEIDTVYNYYNPEFEGRAEELPENSISSLYDIFSSKSYDSRSQQCSYRRKIVCLDKLVGTERNVLYVADDLEEVAFINSITEESRMVPFGSLIKLPVRYSGFNALLKNNSLLTRMSLDVFDGIASRDSEFANVEGVYITDSVRSFVKNSVFVDASLWLEGVKKQKFNSFDYDGFPVTIYDFGQLGKDITLNIDRDLSISSKSILAGATEDEIKPQLNKDILDFWNLKPEHAKRFGYYIQKKTDNFGIQKFLAVTSQSFDSTLNLFDMQVKFDKNYKYIVDSAESFVSTEYYYDVDLGGRSLDKKDGSIYFTLFVKNKLGILNVPLVEKEVKIIDSFPVCPEVSVEQYRDNKHECLFLLNSGVGEKKEKFVALNDNDLAIFNDYKNKVSEEIISGLITFKSDDPAIGFEVYGCDFSPKSYLDFSKIDYVDNTIMNNNNKIVVSSNSFKVKLDDTKFYYFFFRQIDVHGKPSNPTNIFKIKFDDFCERSVLTTEVLTAEEVFNSKKVVKNVKNLRRYLFAKTKNEIMQNFDLWEKEYRFKLISKKTFKECNIDVKFVVKNEDVY